MRVVRVVIVAWLLCMLALWIRGGRGFCVLDALPLVQRGEPFSREYEGQALAALLIGAWGCWMLSRKHPVQRPPERRRFRSGILMVPAAIIALALITPRVRPALSFDDAVGHTPKLLEHTYLAVLCVVVYAVVLAVKWFRNL